MKSKVISKKAPTSEMPFRRAIIPSRPSNSLLRIITNKANLKKPKAINGKLKMPIINPNTVIEFAVTFFSAKYLATGRKRNSENGSSR